MSALAELPKPGSVWRNKKLGKNYTVPLGAEATDDGFTVVAVNMDACWAGPVDHFAEEFEEVSL